MALTGQCDELWGMHFFISKSLEALAVSAPTTHSQANITLIPSLWFCPCCQISGEWITLGDCVLTFFRSPSCLRVFQAFTVLVLPSFLLLSGFLNFHLLCLCHDVGYLGTWVLQPRDPPHVLEWNCLGVPCPFQSLCCLPALGSVQVAEGSGHLLLRLSFPVANMWNISLNFSSLVYI